MGDFNRDGNPDLAVANYDSNNVSLLLNTSNLTITSLPPTVITKATKSVTATSATLNGTLHSLVSAYPVQVSFQWGLTNSYGNETDPESKTTTGNFTASLTSLTPGTT